MIINPFLLFAGSGATYTLAGGGYEDDGLGSNSRIGLDLDTGGTLTITRLVNGDQLPANEFMRPLDAVFGATLYARVALTSGTWSTTAGTDNTWLSLASPLTWTRTRNTVGISSVIFTLSIATDALGSNIVATASYQLDAIK